MSLLLPLSSIKVATAIANQNLENLVVSTALENNWQIVGRAVESSDLAQFDANVLMTENTFVVTGFSGRIINLTGSETSSDIVALVSSFHEKPTLKLRMGSGKNFAICGLGGGVGVTTIAINLAFEFAKLNLPTHLIDFDQPYPLVAPYLGIHDLRRKPVKLLSNLLISQANFNDPINYFEFLQNQIDQGTTSIFDLGSQNTSPISAVKIYVARMDLASISNVQDKLLKGGSQEDSWLILNMRQGNILAKKLEDQLVSILENSKIKRVRILPFDAKSIEATQNSRSALMEVASRGHLRRSISELANELI